MVRAYRLPPILSHCLLLCALVVSVASAQSEMVIQKEGTRLYHRAACPAVKDGKGVLALTRAQAESRGLKPHPSCDPSKKGSDTDGASGSSEDLPTRFVFVGTSKYYHRETCPRLEKDSKRLELDTAGKKYWPCPRCRPPVRKRSAERAIPKPEGGG